MRKQSKIVALGGVTAALAVVIMCMGTLIPIATYVCPLLCAILLAAVLGICGQKAAWAWYGAVALLSLLMCPDKEAAAVFIFLGYYPIIKPKLDKLPARWLWKLLLFNGAALIMYALLIHVFGMAEILSEFQEIGLAVCLIVLLLGNVTFFMLDRLLGMRLVSKRQGRKYG